MPWKAEYSAAMLSKLVSTTLTSSEGGSTGNEMIFRSVLYYAYPFLVLWKYKTGKLIRYSLNIVDHDNNAAENDMQDYAGLLSFIIPIYKDVF